MQLTPGPHFMIYHHEEKKYNQPGMTLLAGIYSSCSTPQALSENHCQLLTIQKTHTAAWSEAFPIARVRNLLSSELQSPSKPASKFLKAQNAAVVRLFESWGFMASPVLRMRVTFFLDTHPSTLSSKGHWPELVSPLASVLELLC